MQFRLLFLLLALLAFPIAAQAQKIPADSARVERKTEDTVYITRSGKKYHRAKHDRSCALPLPLQKLHPPPALRREKILPALQSLQAAGVITGRVPCES
ncbi:MAG: hypothetical protein ACHQNE_00945 [Candidatus Kapaibacterium sp.]